MGKTENPGIENVVPDRPHASQGKVSGESRSETVKRSVELMLSVREQGDRAETKQAADQVAETLLDHYLDRWRNDKKNGYQTIFEELDLLNENETITDLVGDDTPEFRENAKFYASHFVDKLANSKMKITPGFLSERVSHGPNHTYRLYLSDRVDDSTQQMATRIFGVELDREALERFRNVAGFENQKTVRQKRVADGMKPSETDFWYLVRMGFQKGDIKTRNDLARFTLDQMKRYG